jgi:hypothetical protein
MKSANTIPTSEKSDSRVSEIIRGANSRRLSHGEMILLLEKIAGGLYQNSLIFNKMKNEDQYWWCVYHSGALTEVSNEMARISMQNSMYEGLIKGLTETLKQTKDELKLLKEGKSDG